MPGRAGERLRHAEHLVERRRDVATVHASRRPFVRGAPPHGAAHLVLGDPHAHRRGERVRATEDRREVEEPEGVAGVRDLCPTLDRAATRLRLQQGCERLGLPGRVGERLLGRLGVHQALDRDAQRVGEPVELGPSGRDHRIGGGDEALVEGRWVGEISHGRRSPR